jgi:hypothetical protein
VELFEEIAESTSSVWGRSPGRRRSWACTGGWTGGDSQRLAGATRIKIAVEPQAITHELTVAKAQSWLETNEKTPHKQAKNVTLRQVLARA